MLAWAECARPDLDRFGQFTEGRGVESWTGLDYTARLRTSSGGNGESHTQRGFRYNTMINTMNVARLHIRLPERESNGAKMPRINAAPFTAAQLRAALSYDPDTGIFTWRQSRIAAKVGSQAGCRKPNGYIEIKLGGVSIGAHRAAWLYVHGELPARMIDHRNHVRDDNRISNLRPADDAQNQWNSTSKRPDIKVKWSTNTFSVRIKHRGKRISIGEFHTLKEAKVALAQAAKRMRGEFYAEPS